MTAAIASPGRPQSPRLASVPVRFGAAAGVVLAVAAAGAGGPANLALGRKVAFAPAPNYALTARGGTDANDLTDGKTSTRTDRKIWFDRGAVGWSYAGLGQMAVDLGAPRDVGEVTVRFQGGSPQAGISVPCWVHVLAGADGKTFHRVASYSRWTEGDGRRLGVPPDTGEAWVHELRFGDLNVRARHIGVEIYGTGLSVCDEVRVLAARSGATLRRPEAFDATAFTVSGPRLYFHKPVLPVPTHLNAPTPVGWIVPEGMSKARVTATLDLPAGVRFVAGRIGGTDLAAAEGEAIEGGAYRRHTFSFYAGKGNKAWRRVYLRGERRAGGVRPLRYRLQWPGGGGPLVEQPVRLVRVPAAPTPKRLMTGLGWWSLPDTMAWPDVLATWRQMGLNTLPLFGRWTNFDDPNVTTTLERFGEAGFRVMNIDSTFHQMLATAERRGQARPLRCRLPGGKAGTKLCPSYRGPAYEAELDRVARECVRCRAAYLSCDIELWGWRGPTDAENCSRCQADFARSGAADWAAWRLAKGEQMWRALAGRVRAACRKAGVEPPEMGVYDFRPGRSYQYFWPFDRLYPKDMGNAQVSTYTPLYPYHLGLIGDEARADREKLPRSDVLPWITPGDAGTFPREALTWAMLECYANGSRGVHFWSGRLWDAGGLAGLAEAVRIAAPVEDVIVDGELVSGVTCTPAMRTSGMRRGGEMFLLIADYARRRTGDVRVSLPDPADAVAVDLATGRPIARLRPPERSFVVQFRGESARAIHVRPEAKE